MATGAMTLADLRAQLQPRFTSETTGTLNIWINSAYTHLFGLKDWTFRKATANPTTVAGSRVLTSLPSHGFIPSGIWDNTGVEIAYVDPGVFYTWYIADATSGSPIVYTVIDEAVQVAPTPSAAATWTMFYEKRADWLSNDSDTPLLPDSYHYLLVPGAYVMGASMASDYTVNIQQALWQEGIEAMSRDYLVDVRGVPKVWRELADVQ